MVNGIPTQRLMITTVALAQVAFVRNGSGTADQPGLNQEVVDQRCCSGVSEVDLNLSNT